MKSHRNVVSWFCRILAVCIPAVLLLVTAHAQHPHAPPSDGAKGIPGAKGTFIFTPQGWKKGVTTFWTDTGDGVDPGRAGCHIEITSATNLTRPKGGRVFGEACTKEGLLIETNPGRNAPHPHKNDQGHPDLFDCNMWCRGAQMRSGGVCRVVNGPAPCRTSAICACK
jgi:hypothetical protein